MGGVAILTISANVFCFGSSLFFVVDHLRKRCGGSAIQEDVSPFNCVEELVLMVGQSMPLDLRLLVFFVVS
jgi:hypothetical protein